MNKIKYNKTIPITQFFNINIPDYTNEDVIKSMNKGTNYYERLDFELVDWECVAHIVHKSLTLQQLLKEIYDKYDLLTLSFILRKSKIQILNKLKDLKLNILETEKNNNESKSIEKSPIVSSFVQYTHRRLVVSLTQTDEKDIEKWFIENNNHQGYDNLKPIKDIEIKNIMYYYLKEKNHLMFFKFMVILFNFFKLPYKIDTDENDVFFVFEYKPPHLEIPSYKLDVMKKIKEYRLIVDKIENKNNDKQ